MSFSAAFGRTAFSSLAFALCAFALGAHAAPVVGTDNVEAIKENKRVVISRFGVEFYTQLFGEGRSGKNTARMTATLEGISDATRQAITEQAYTDTVQTLQKAGYEVLDLAPLASQPVFQTLEAKYAKPSPYLVEDEKMLQGGKQLSQIIAPAGRMAYFQSGSARGDLSQRIDAQNQGIGRQAGDLAKAVGATLLEVHVLASFGTVSATKNGALRIFAGSAARAGIEAQPVLFPEETQIQIINTEGARTFGNSRRMGHTGAVYLKEPLVAATNIFEMRDTMPEGEKDKQSAMNMLTGFLSGTSERTATSAVKASSEEAYRATYQALIREAIESLVAGLGNAR